MLRRSILFAVSLILASAASATSLHNKAVPGQALGFAPVGPTGASYSAVVGPAGNLVRGVGITSSTRNAVGNYIVEFTNDITACAYVATAGETGSTGAVPATYPTVVKFNPDLTGVYVELFDTAGNPVDEPFHLDVGC